MEDETLSDKFRSSVVPDSLYWSSSLDSRVQFAQSQGADGGKADTTTIYGDIQQRIVERRRKQSRDTGEALARVLEEALQRYNEASRAAEMALRELGATVATSRESHKALMTQFDAKTVKLSHGTPVYYDIDTGALVHQDETDVWQNLESEADIQQALTAIAENGGYVTTKQGKLALDIYEQEIERGAEVYEDSQEQLYTIEAAVDNKTMSLDEAEQLKQDIVEDVNATRKRILNRGNEAEIQARAVDISEQAAFREKARQTLQRAAHSPDLSAAFKAVFSDETITGSSRPERSAPAHENDLSM